MSDKIWNDVIKKLLAYSKKSNDYNFFIQEMRRAGYDISHAGSNKVEDKIFFADVIAYFNEKANTNYTNKFPSSISRMILTLKKDGYTIEQLKGVIDLKINHWRGTPVEQHGNVTPKAMFKKIKFESYVGQLSPNGSAFKKESQQGEFSSSVSKARQTPPAIPAGSGKGR